MIFVRLHATIHQSYDANKNTISAFRKIDGHPITIVKITDETLNTREPFTALNKYQSVQN